MRITQSAVSKRLASLAAESRKPLTERSGRRVHLTPFGLMLVTNARPVLASLKDLLRAAASTEHERLVIGVSDSIMSSWGASLLSDVAARLPGITLDLHVHRSVLAVEMVRSGDYNAALCADAGNIGTLQAVPLFLEPMVIIPAHLTPIQPRAGATLPVITIEPSSATWLGIRDQLRRHRGKPGKIEVACAVESFAAVAQMAAAGFGHGLVPLGVARALRIKAEALLRFEPSVSRRISFVARASTLGRPSTGAVIAAIQASKVVALFTRS